MITFLEYLSKKNIDADAFLLAEPTRYREWETLFAQISPDSFTVQKKFLINETRRQFLLPALNASPKVNPPADIS